MKRRSIANFHRHFGGTRNISSAVLSFAILVPAILVGVIAFAVVAHTGNIHAHGFLGHVVAPFAALGATLAGLVAFKTSGKIIATFALAVGLATGNAGGQQPDPTVVNAAARAAVLSQSVEMEQQIFSAAINPTTQTVVPVVPRNVGLIKRFRVIVSGTIQNTDGAIDATRTPFGVANVVQNVQFYDLQNNLRINTTGWHLTMLEAAKYRDAYNSSLTQADYTTGVTSSTVGNFGNNFPVAIDLIGLTHGTNQPFRHVYEVPLAYSDDDLRGGIFANVVNATMNLQVSLTPANLAFVAAAADDTQAVLKAGTCSYLGNVTITVYQVYLDQLPQGKNGAVLPIIDLSTVYEIKNTTFQNLVANQEFPVPYSNFRDFLSTFLVYNNNGAQGHGNGTDINYFSLQSANFTNIWKLDPLSLYERIRKLMPADFPAGTYYISYRRKPISTVQYGNMQVIINPITAAAGNYLLVGFEAFALQNVITQAGSLSAA